MTQAKRPGTARISRYSARLKVQRLPIEPISQASADQRKGRCGRTADGICIRLYDEEDFAARPRFLAVAEALRFLDDAFGFAAGAGDDVVAVRLGLVDGPVRVRAGPLHVPEGLHHRLSLTRGYLERKTRQYEALHAELASLRAELAAGEGSGQPVDQRQRVNPGLNAGPPADTTNP